MSQKQKIRAMKNKCERCFEKRETEFKLTEWSPQNHWMFDKMCKSFVKFLMLIHMRKKLVPKDVWLIIIKYTIEKSRGKRIKNSKYCAACLELIFREKPCNFCEFKVETAPFVKPDYFYKLGKNSQFMKFPAICLKCKKLLYTCVLHEKETPLDICYNCEKNEGFKSNLIMYSHFILSRRPFRKP